MSTYHFAARKGSAFASLSVPFELLLPLYPIWLLSASSNVQ